MRCFGILLDFIFGSEGEGVRIRISPIWKAEPRPGYEGSRPVLPNVDSLTLRVGGRHVNTVLAWRLKGKGRGRNIRNRKERHHVEHGEER